MFWEYATEHEALSDMFLAHMLRHIGVQDIVVWDEYPDLDDEKVFENVMNLM